MDHTVKELDERITKLEYKSFKGLRFFIQYLLSPILVVLIGVIVNWQIEQDRKQVQQITIAQSMLSTLFSDEEFKTLATKRLMDEVLQDEALKHELGEIITDYMNSKFIASSEKGDYEAAIGVYTAVKALGGEAGQKIAVQIKESKQSETAFTNYEIAKRTEVEGFDALVRGDYEEAKEKFRTAYDVYPRYHSVSEIYRLLQRSQRNFNDYNAMQKVIKKIVDDYSWKAPKDSIQKLRNKINS